MEPLIIQELFNRRPQAWIQFQNPSKKILYRKVLRLSISLHKEKGLLGVLASKLWLCDDLTPDAVLDMFYQWLRERSKVQRHIRKYFNFRLNNIFQLVIRKDDHFADTVDGLW